MRYHSRYVKTSLEEKYMQRTLHKKYEFTVSPGKTVHDKSAIFEVKLNIEK